MDTSVATQPEGLQYPARLKFLDEIYENNKITKHLQVSLVLKS